jgi:endonuclease/exonuclease/phosphatase family metal-dependent hydrolase
LWVVQLAGTLEATAVFAFFYQALRVFFSVLFGVIYDVLFAERVPLTTAGLFLGLALLALLAPLAVPRKLPTRRFVMTVGAILVFGARIPLTLNDPQVRLVAAILIVAGTGLYLTARLRSGVQSTARALILALVVDQALRAAGQTFDITLRPAWLAGQVAVSVALCVLAGWTFWRGRADQDEATSRPGLLGGLAYGGWLFLEMALLAFPNAVARWSGVPYDLAAPLLLLTTLLSIVAAFDRRVRSRRWLPGICVVGLLAGLAAGYLATGPLALGGLLVAHSAALLLLPAILTLRPASPRDRLGLALSVGGIAFLILSFLNAFSYTYAYTLDLFRGTGLPTFLVAGLLCGLGALRRSSLPEPGESLVDGRVAAVLGMALILVVTLLAWQRAPVAGATEGPLRFATYNIHYGYDTHWHVSLEAQARTIEASGADVVALQEVDAGRQTSYMVDDALWLARQLDMEAVYLPSMEHLTGIALLSRLPVLETGGTLLPSQLEQTGIVWALVDAAVAQGSVTASTGGTVNAYGIWLGLEPDERLRQLDSALSFIDAHPGPASVGGDFNTEPESPVYARIVTSGFVDPFPALGLGSPPTDPALNPTKRIDFVWLRDLAPADANVSESTASDHRLVVVGASRP